MHRHRKSRTPGWGSAEGMIPSSDAERAELTRRGLKPVSQTNVQQHLVDQIHGFHGAFR